MRNTFIQTLERCRSDDVYLLTADLGFNLFEGYRDNHPDRFLNMGIAETNMIGVAAGLALSGKKVYCYSMIPFLTTRCFEHIRVDVCYHNLDVRLVGVGGGLVYGLEGVTHQATEDMAIMRSLPNMTVVAPGDPHEVSACVKASLRHRGPMYIRLGRAGEPTVHPSEPDFEIGRGIMLSNRGHDICLLVTGSLLPKAKITAELLSDMGLGVTLISLHTVKPLDEALIKGCANEYRSIFTLEEHSVVGGLGSAVAEALAEARYGGVFRRIGLPDRFNRHVGRTEYLHHRYGLIPEAMADVIARSLKGD